MTRIAAFGGPYSNPYALRALLDDARQRGCERIFCLGDLGGFGAEPDALWPLLVDGGVECIAGNYDIAIGRGDEDCGCGYSDPRDNAFAQLIYDFTRARTSPGFAQWMSRLPGDHREVIGGVDMHLVHGSPLFVNDFFWESLSDEEVRLRLDASGAQVVLCTHSGLPWQKRLDDGRLAVNVGVIGRPANDGRTNVWYAVLDLEAGHVEAELVPLEYDWRAQASSMRAAGLPEPFVETIETGWWTTCWPGGASWITSPMTSGQPRPGPTARSWTSPSNWSPLAIPDPAATCRSLTSSAGSSHDQGCRVRRALFQPLRPQSPAGRRPTTRV